MKNKVYVLSELTYFGGDVITIFPSRVFITKDRALDCLDELTNWDKPYREDLSDPTHEIYEYVTDSGRSYYFSITETTIE